ncbi:hypothetical protein N656DRAFT_833316, partial [Canariomyces notabilis]
VRETRRAPSLRHPPATAGIVLPEPAAATPIPQPSRPKQRERCGLLPVRAANGLPPAAAAGRRVLRQPAGRAVSATAGPTILSDTAPAAAEARAGKSNSISFSLTCLACYHSAERRRRGLTRIKGLL